MMREEIIQRLKHLKDKINVSDEEIDKLCSLICDVIGYLRSRNVNFEFTGITLNILDKGKGRWILNVGFYIPNAETYYLLLLTARISQRILSKYPSEISSKVNISLTNIPPITSE